jgi:KaiC/GvpD/RAD55 family RecA-like ATPase
MDEFEKIKTGIDGLDEMLYGGIPRGYTVFVSGHTGTGKTTLGMQFLAYGARQGESGLFATLEESASRIVRNFKVFDPEIEAIISSGRLKISESKALDFETFKLTLENEIIANKVKRLVIDSTAYLQILFSDALSFRKAIIELESMLENYKITTLLIGEMQYGSKSFSASGVEEVASDGVIAMYTIRKQSSYVRALRIIKMRGSKIMTRLSPYEFVEGKGIIVYTNAEIFR